MFRRPEALDPALLRPGRFDYHLELPTPDEEGRAAILAVHLARLKRRGTIGVEALARATEGCSGADLAALVREAALAAIGRGVEHGIAPGRLAVTPEDLHAALAGLPAKRLARNS